jgi:HEAT repeat protein
MTRASLGIPLLIVSLAIVAQANRSFTAQESLARRVTAVRDGTVGMTFPARADVCGDGRTFISERQAGLDGYATYLTRGVDLTNWDSGNTRLNCVQGPVRVILVVQRSRVVEVQPFVGGSRGVAPAETDLGSVPAADAVSYLLSLARRQEDIANRAMLAAYLADGARISPTLFEFARDEVLSAEVREIALKFIARASERDGTTRQALTVAREVMQGQAPHSVRERAIRVLGELPGGDAMIRAHFASLDDRTLQERAVRSVGESGGRTNAEWLQAFVLDVRQPADVRERAIRTLVDEFGQLAEMRSLYNRLDDATLRERVIRSVGDRGLPADRAWLRSIAEDKNESHSVRDRAIRIIGEYGSQEDAAWLEQLAAGTAVESELRERAVRSLFDAGVASEKLAFLYDRAEDERVRERILRLLADRGDDAATDKLIDIVNFDRNQSLRERAIKSLAELRNEKARKFIESRIR